MMVECISTSLFKDGKIDCGRRGLKSKSILYNDLLAQSLSVSISRDSNEDYVER